VESVAQQRGKAVTTLNQALFGAVREFERFRVAIARDNGVTVTELRALARIGDGDALGAGGRITPKQLATQLELTTGAVTALTDRLVDDGLVEREPNPDDRRSLLLAPTEAGDKLLAAVVAHYEELVRQATGEVDTAQLDELSGLLATIVAHARQQDFA